MKPVRQTRISPKGNCLAACISSLLGIKIEEIPDFIAMEDDGTGNYPIFWLEMQAFLSKRNLFFLEIQLGNIPWMPLPYDVFGIAIGLLPSGSPHAIIVKCEGSNFEPVFCPLGKNPDEYNEFVIERICFLVPRDAELFERMGSALERIKVSTRGINNPALKEAIQEECAFALGQTIIAEKPKFRIVGPDGLIPGAN